MPVSKLRRRRAGVVIEWAGTGALVSAAVLFGAWLVLLLVWSNLTNIQGSHLGNAAETAALALVVPLTAVGAWKWRSERDAPLSLALTVAVLVLIATSLTFMMALISPSAP